MLSGTLVKTLSTSQTVKSSNTLMNNDTPGWLEWMDAISSGKTALPFPKWKESNAKAVKKAKKRIDAVKRRRQEKIEAQSTAGEYEPAPQVEITPVGSARAWDSVEIGTGDDDDVDLDGFRYINNPNRID